MEIKHEQSIGIEGNLEVMDLPTLIQFIGQEGSEAVIQLTNDAQSGSIFLKGSYLSHAELIRSDRSEIVGEEAVYELLRWSNGRFKVEKEVPAPELTVEQPWDFLLMEGIRRIDEGQQHQVNVFEDFASAETILTTDTDTKFDSAVNNNSKELLDMANLEQTLEAIMGIGGAKAAALVDWESGMTLGTIGSGFNIELAAAGNTNVVRAKMGVMKDLQIKGGIEDILITLDDQYHIIRILKSNENLFIYLALDRASANLGMARHKLSALEKELSI